MLGAGLIGDAAMIHRENIKSPIVFPDTMVYICSAVKDAKIKLIPKNMLEPLQLNVKMITSLFQYNTMVYYTDEDSYEVLESWNKTIPESNMILLKEKLIGNKMENLAYGRTLLMKTVQTHWDELQNKNDNQITTSYIVMIDFNPHCVQIFNRNVFIQAMKLNEDWDSLSFHRTFHPGYYDIWALRYERFDVNIWDFGSLSKGVLNIMTEDITSLLDSYASNNQLLFPVYSAFNGVAIYKVNMTIGCEYYPYQHISYKLDSRVDECEHVPFHKCMISKNNARNMIFTR